MSTTFRSLANPNFRLWIIGNVMASSATWMQRVAQDWLVLTQLSHHSGTQVGIVTALQFLPFVLFTPWAGLLADRADRRRVVQACQVVTAVLALVLGVLVLTGVAQIWHVYVLAFIGGTASSIEAPARQAFVSELVPDELLPNAIGLNSTAFNIARIIGPGLAGVVIDWVGTGWVFVANGAILMVPVTMLAIIDATTLMPHERLARAKGQIVEGMRYVRARPDILMVMVVITVVSGLGLNFQLTSAMMATEVFGKAAGEYGALASIMAVGSVTGALLAARRQVPRLRTVVMAAGFFGLVQFALALSPTYWSFALISIPLGLCTLTLVTSANAFVQISTPEAFRGRVLALYTMVFLGTTPLGSPLVGWIGETFGARWSLLVGAISSMVVAVAAAVWAARRWNLRLRWDRRARRVVIDDASGLTRADHLRQELAQDAPFSLPSEQGTGGRGRASDPGRPWDEGGAPAPENPGDQSDAGAPEKPGDSRT
ncbi:MFS transporter [Schaalia sp. 19OD2882]|uniref:MFS transporter n=1 Tax=Schaalia sp. 19OD2882 TaxID=2794089 RepID=UPI001C1E9FE4|nr:MFS transporter [Schaalia sp. 19OD2882]QWW19931.1 MFS transporter [Schaalia sp. 19OD2882]